MAETQLTDEQYRALSPAERRTARAEGRVNAVLGAPAAPPGTGPLSAEQYSRLTRDDRRRARAEGRVDHLITTTTEATGTDDETADEAPRPRFGNVNQSPRVGSPPVGQLTSAEYMALSPADRRTARAEGRTDRLLRGY